MDVAGWRALARDVLLDMLGTEHAMVWREVEAKASETVWPGAGRAINPHHFTWARQQLEGKLIEAPKAATRGGRPIEVLHLKDPDARRIATKVNRVSGRKRLLYGRYLGWTTSTKAYPQGFIGQAGEQVLRATLDDLASEGFVPAGEGPRHREVAHLLGVRIPGAVDAASHLTVTDRHGLPRVVTVVFEEKNVRHWLYADSRETYQALHKAALLQREHPDQLILPVTVSRRRQWTQFTMGQDLGFYSVQTRAHFLPQLTRIADAGVEEVRMELGFIDLQKQGGPYPRLRNTILRDSLKPRALVAAERWREVGSQFLEHYEVLRRGLRHRRRAVHYDELRDAARDFGMEGSPDDGWLGNY